LCDALLVVTLTLFSFSFSLFFKMQSVFEMMVRKGEGSYAKKDAELDMLHRVVAYCLNEVDCRRQVVLEHFGEHFNAADCRGTCDNCSGGFAVEAKDLTRHAQSIVRLFMSVRSIFPLFSLLSLPSFLISSDSPLFLNR